MTDPRSAQPGSYEASGHGAEPGGDPRTVPGSGRAGARPNRPDAASPAGWSPPPAGEAAPPVRYRGPARSDNVPERAADPRPASMYRIPVRSSSWGARRPLSTPQAPADRPFRGGPEGNAPGPDMRWPSLTRPGPSRIPVVGPTETVLRRGAAALPADAAGSRVSPAPVQARRERDPGPAVRGRAGGPGGQAPPGAASGRTGPERQSGWQVAQRVWQDSGVDWENVPGPAEGDPYAAPDPYAAAAFTAHPYAPSQYESGAYRPGQYDSGQYDPGRYESGAYRSGQYDSGHYESGAYRPGQYESGAYGAGSFEPDPDDAFEPDPDESDAFAADSDEAGSYESSPFPGGPYQSGPSGAGPSGADPHPTTPDLFAVPPDSRFGMGPWPTQEPPGQPEGDPALDGRVPEEPPAPSDPAQPPDPAEPDEPEAPEDFAAPGRPEVPEGSGAPGWNGDQRGIPGRPWPGDRRQGAPRRPAYTPAGTGPASPGPASSGFAASAASPSFAERRPPLEPRWATTSRSFAAPPLSAPVAPSAPPLAESDELFRAWQGSVREATARPAAWADRRPAPAMERPPRRGRGRQAARIGVPAAVIVMVGAGALLMLTGRANEMLAERADTGPLASATPGVSASLSPAGTTLAGYPGEHGTVGVAAMWSAGGRTVAVGYADGHPAVWLHAADGSWSLVSAVSLGGLPGHLTSVAEGSQGWIAVGSVSENGTVEPMVYRSADGTTWTPVPSLTALAGSGAQFLGVAAGPGGYVVVGKTGSGEQASVALWWSADLASWVSGGSGGSTGSFAAAAVALDDGFIAVGSENNCHTIWTSLNGRQWTAHDLAKPAGAHTATLLSVAAGSAGHIVAAGYAVNSAGDMPIVVVSTDGGAHTTQVVLDSPDGPASVTAVTATSGGFVAAGLAGPAGAQRAVTWTSPNGLTWSAAVPLTSAGASEVTALANTSTAGTAKTLIGTAQRGASSALLTVPAP